jgi:hypothetical protein
MKNPEWFSPQFFLAILAPWWFNNPGVRGVLAVQSGFLQQGF